MNKNNENWGHAASMFTLYMKSRDLKGNVSNEQLDALSERFGQVDINDRAEVFMKFIDLLDSSGVNYDRSQFAN